MTTELQKAPRKVQTMASMKALTTDQRMALKKALRTDLSKVLTKELKKAQKMGLLMVQMLD